MLKIFKLCCFTLIVAAEIPNAFSQGNNESAHFFENRKGILNLGFGFHKVCLAAREAPVSILGILTCDSRSNLDSERRLVGLATGGEIVEFTLPFKSRPLVICSGGYRLKMKISPKQKLNSQALPEATRSLESKRIKVPDSN